MEEVKSKYHSGNFRENRRNKLWDDANTHSRNGLFVMWNEDLDCIWSELCADIKPDDFKCKKEEFDKFDKEILDIGKIEDKSKKGFKELDNDFYLKRDKHYKKLREKEIFLRRLENSLGKSGEVDNNEDYD